MHYPLGIERTIGATRDQIKLNQLVKIKQYNNSIILIKGIEWNKEIYSIRSNKLESIKDRKKGTITKPDNRSYNNESINDKHPKTINT